MEIRNPSAEFLEEFPTGKWTRWKFYWNIWKGGHNIKLGDCVHVKTVSGKNVDMMRIQYLIKDKDGKPWFSGYHFFGTHQIHKMSAGRIQERHKIDYPNMKFTVASANGWAPLDTITNPVCCLYLPDYKKGRPVSFPKIETYPIIYAYNFRQDMPPNLKKVAVDMIRADIPDCIDYKACTAPWVWKDHTPEESADLKTRDRAIAPTKAQLRDDFEPKTPSSKRKSGAGRPKGSTAKKAKKTSPSVSSTTLFVSSESSPVVPRVIPPIASPSPARRPGPKSKTQVREPQLNGYLGADIDLNSLAPTIGVPLDDPHIQASDLVTDIDDLCNFDSHVKGAMVS